MGYTVDFNDEENDDLVVTIDLPFEPEADPADEPEATPAAEPARRPAPQTAIDHEVARAPAPAPARLTSNTRLIAWSLLALVVLGFLVVFLVG